MLTSPLAPTLGLLLLILTLLVFTPQAWAQEEPRAVETTSGDIGLRLSGTFQPRFSAGLTTDGAADDTERVGFGLRRARFRATATFMSRFGVHYDVDLGSGNLDSVDLYGFYDAADNWRFRFGYLAGPQPRAYNLTSHTRIDAIERAAIAERWSRATIGSRGRVFGFETQFQTDEVTVKVAAHNGDSSFDRTRGNFRESPSGSSVTRGVDQTSLAASAYAAYEPTALPGFEIGGYAGFNASRNPNTAIDDDAPGRDYVGYSGHLYWGARPGSQPIRIKGEVIGIRYFELDGRAAIAPEQHTLGWAAFGALRVLSHGEIFGRYEQFYADVTEDSPGADAFVTAGASYSLSARRGLDYRQERITLAYANQLPDAASLATQHLIVLQFQFVF